MTRQLSAHDAEFLYADTTHSNANVTLLHIYNQSTAPGGTVRFKSILAHIENRIAALPLLRQRLQRVPLNLDFPYWVDDENFDLEYHVRHIALPKPGDWRQFCIQASRIHSRPLDLQRPLWEIYVIEGLNSFLDLPEDSFALLTKVHHAAIDVEHGSVITDLLHDLGPEPPAATPAPPWFPESPPGLVGMLARGALHAAVSSVRLAGPLGHALRRAAPAALSLAQDLLRPPRRGPVTRFNAIVSAHRVFETRRFALAEFEAIRTLVEGASLHDAVLAVCGGALRRYLEGHGELPRTPLTAMTPVAVPAGGDTDAAAASRELTWVRVALATDEADPVRRLARIRLQTAAAQAGEGASHSRERSEIRRHLPSATLALSAKLLGRTLSGPGRRAPLASCTVTQVPGPAQPRYLCGARMTYFSAIMPIADGMGLVIAVTDYDGQVIVSPTSCRELMPDPAVFAQCLRDSFQELLALARLHEQQAPHAARPARDPTAAPRRASPSGRRSSTSPPA